MHPRRHVFIFIAGLVVFGLGICVGAAYRSAGSAAGESSSLREPQNRLKVELSRQPNLPSKQASVASNEGPGEDARARMAAAPWRVLADLQDRKLASPAITFLSGSGKLSEAFSSLLALTDSERAALQQSVDRACERLTDLQRQNATITREENGNVTIAVKSFAIAGGLIYDEVMGAFAKTLGPERNAAFVTLGGEQVERALGRFGIPDWNYTFTLRPGHPKGQIYSVKQGYVLPNENGSGMLGFSTLEEMENRLGPVVRLLPRDFTSK